MSDQRDDPAVGAPVHAVTRAAARRAAAGRGAARHAARPAHRARDPRHPALLAFALLGTALVVLLVLTTPWNALPSPEGGRVDPDLRRDFSPAEHAREDDYHRPLWVAVIGSMAAGLAAALLLGLTSAGARLVGAVARPLGGRRGVQLVLGTVAVTALTTLATLPFAIWREQIQRDAGLIVRDWGSFATDSAKQYGIVAGATLIGLGTLLLLVKLFPRRWWAPGALVGGGLVVLSSYVYPIVVEPAFNDFRSMEAGPLRSELLALARADGVEVSDVLVADASRRTSRVNAYVSGIGSSRRIVIYDTTLEALSPAQIRTIIAHELGHVDDDDVLRGTIEGALGLATAICLIFAVVGSPGVRRRAGLLPLGETDDRGRRADTDPRSVALVLALVALLAAVTTPAQLLVSRKVEARADAHALDLTRDPATMAAMQREITLNNLGDLDPGLWVRALRSTHPTPPERIALARTWARLHGVPEPSDMAGWATRGSPAPLGPGPAPAVTPRPTATAKATTKATTKATAKATAGPRRP